MNTTKKLYDVREVLDIFPVSRAGLYLACSKGEIPTIKLGRRIMIPAWWVDEKVNKPVC